MRASLPIVLALLLAACSPAGKPRGDGLQLDELRGQWVLINYWATWCKPCIQEIPELNALAQQYPGVTVLGRRQRLSRQDSFKNLVLVAPTGSGKTTRYVIPNVLEVEGSVVVTDPSGEIYQHTLMTPMFSPGKAPYGLPPIFLAGVGPKMTEVCGEVADGFFLHPFGSRDSFEKLTLPALERGLERAGRSRDDLEISVQVMIATGATDEEVERMRQSTKQQIAFYASTPAYRPVLDVHGWGDLQPELNALTKQGRWADMPGLVSDELLEAIAICAPIGEVAARVRERFGGRADRVSLVAHWTRDPDVWDDVVRDLSAAD